MNPLNHHCTSQCNHRSDYPLCPHGKEECEVCDIDSAVARAVVEYGETFKKLNDE